MKNFAVVYNGGNTESRYVGSLSDYISGEMSIDPILMSEEEANELLKELDNYVRNEEHIGKTDEDNDQAHWAYEKGEWGFYIEDLDFGHLDYMGALVNYGGDPLLIEDEDDAMALASAIDRAQYGIREIEKDSEEWHSALKKLDLADVNDVKHIYSGVDGSEFIFCKAEDWVLTIDTLQDLADYINGCDEFNAKVVEEIIECNGWINLTGNNDYDICSYMGEKLVLDENTAEAGVVDDNSVNIHIGQRIQELRKEAGLTQKDLAEKCGMAQPNIARIEAGTYATSIDVLSRIAEALGKKIELV